MDQFDAFRAMGEFWTRAGTGFFTQPGTPTAVVLRWLRVMAVGASVGCTMAFYQARAQQPQQQQPCASPLASSHATHGFASNPLTLPRTPHTTPPRTLTPQAALNFSLDALWRGARFTAASVGAPFLTVLLVPPLLLVAVEVVGSRVPHGSAPKFVAAVLGGTVRARTHA